MSSVREADMFALQLDTVSHFYEFYRQLALSALASDQVENDADLAIVRGALEDWDGRAAKESRGLVFLISFRERLAQAVFAPFLRVCAELEEEFVYSWPNMDTPLRIMLTERPLELLLEPANCESWEQFILTNLQDSVERVKEVLKVKSLAGLNWGRVNKAKILHHLAQGPSVLDKLLNMPEDSLPGCDFCICVNDPSFGTTARLVVSPGRESEGLLHMPCGQSGHPLSDHYDDQHQYWTRQESLPFLPGQVNHTMIMTPGVYA
jgi:penicillin amidase